MPLLHSDFYITFVTFFFFDAHFPRDPTNSIAPFTTYAAVLYDSVLGTSCFSLYIFLQDNLIYFYVCNYCLYGN